MMKKMDKGFTLVELMIVVAIIGILAAVAIPGFMKYIKDSKTTEAKTNIKAMAEGALSFFQTEHAKDATGSVYFTKQFPSATYCKSSAAGGACVGAANQPAGIQDTGAKTSITNNLGVEPWISLNFQVSAPVYYTYAYSGTKDAGFVSQAAAKLDSKSAVDSCFKITGLQTDGEPSIGAIVDLSESTTKCTAAVAVK